jgi:methionyl-tRNA formyltransferase
MMRIVMFGTGPFAVPTLESLLDSKHEVLALVTRPIADAGKRRKTSENPSRDLGESRGIQVFDPASANDADFVRQLEELKPDLFVVCDYGQILSRACLAASRLGGINLHGSLLPKYRGAAPIHWAIFHGDIQTGITIIHMTAKLDGGPCLVQAVTDIGLSETTEQIEPRLAALGVQPVHDAIAMLEGWDGESSIGEIQDPKLATRAPRLKKSDGRIDWSRSAAQIVNQIRAFQPWPGTFTNWHTAHFKQPLRLIVHAATAEPESPPEGDRRREPGCVTISDHDRLLIQTGDGWLSIIQIQSAGKRAMPIADFLRGHQPAIGDAFG